MPYNVQQAPENMPETVYKSWGLILTFYLIIINFEIGAKFEQAIFRKFLPRIGTEGSNIADEKLLQMFKNRLFPSFN